jgi:predicted transcriptional regulator
MGAKRPKLSLFAIIMLSLRMWRGDRRTHTLEIPRLKEWRLRRAMAQRDLAAASGVGAATIARLERGHQLARPSTVRRLAEALGVRPDVLMVEPMRKVSKAEGE